MKFHKLIAKNVYSFRDLSFDFSHHGTTLILGKNLDQNTANGAGKSSILKTLYFALWGKELNGESVDLIRTRGEKDGFIVELDFEDRGHNYKIIRYRDRKEKEAKTGVEFYIDDKAFNGETAVDTQKIIERKLKISPRLFLSSILTAQNETKHFLTVNDTEKKELFSELLDLTAYSKAYDIVKEEISSKEKELLEVSQKIENLSEKIKEKSKEIEDFELKEDSFEDIRIQEKNKIAMSLSDCESLLGQFEKTEEDILKLENDLIEITDKNNKIKKELDDLRLKSKDEQALSDLLFEYRSDAQKLENSLENLRAQKIQLESDILESDSSKSERERIIHEFISTIEDALKVLSVKSIILGMLNVREFFLEQLRGFNQKKEQLVAKLNSVLEKEKDLEEKIITKKSSQDKLKQKLDKLLENKTSREDLHDDFVKSSSELNGVVKALSEKKRALSEKKALLEKTKELKAKLIEVDTKESPYKELVSFAIEKRASFQTSLDLGKKTYSRLEDELVYLSFWKAAFSPIGIRSFIFDEVLDLLNRKVQSNLNDLFEGAMSVIFESESKTQKGSISNKINTKFFLSGKETTFGLLSGGEQQRAILAVNLALSEVAESYSGSVMNIKFLDEPFNGIDSSGQIQCFKLFSRLSQTKDGLYVISHDESFQQLCPNAVYIIKKNGVSALTDRVSFEQIRNN
jgi:DNA repair exonuclease SbcCD ATPase subunit